MSGEGWDFFKREHDGPPEFVFVDLLAERTAPDPSRPVRLTVVIPFRLPYPNGLPRREEADELWEYEDRLQAAIESHCNARFVGRVTGRGRRVHYFYTAAEDAGAPEAVRRAAAGTGYEPSLEFAADPTWSAYFDHLLPDDLQRQEMEDRRVLESLQEAGDDLSQDRGIHHWAYFPTSETRDAFLAAARERGFTGLELHVENPKDGRAFGAQLHRVDPVRPPAVFEVIATLFRLARDHEGDYDGWETQLLKPGDEPSEDAPPGAR